jgi:hypothetical protein
MSTPEEPRYGTGYGGARYPLPPGQEPPTQQAPVPQGGGYPYGQYSPYGPYTPPPAGTGGGLDRTPPPRPGAMILGLVLLLLAALPFLAFGLVFLLVPIGPELLPPNALDNPALSDAGITSPEAFVSVLRIMAGFFTALAAVYVIFAIIAFTGRNWARILVAVMTAGFSVFLILGFVSAVAVDPAGAAIVIAPVVLAVGGLATWFAPQANRWYAAR